MTDRTQVLDGAPTMFLMVGLPGAGKTTTSKKLQHERRALRLTPDEWMIPLFGEPEADGKRDVLEGRFVWLALRALRARVHVVLDFGCWTRNERPALRALATSTCASCEIVYLELDDDAQRTRQVGRSAKGGSTAFEMSDADLARFRNQLQVPDEVEQRSGDPEGSPLGTFWAAWVASRWPTPG